ncbi:adenosylcobinamide-GDP ribazoletransferase [Halalkalicoccus jeotgali]|uniref:Adenosylcobinamide-GDP ribazoletransferase n=1 Tax=Halalkalicoccus jeotgali (strain DSM 18796 / CECT 7217 / JCM 14584 / KCTC 4019 / B3) TaxID=795797 RepID=D8J6Y5_HALJB|nr:adenosylcobinamide-GDP ribazoletransferase [Halalkalicoccus jeotgali]ADJ15938.1 cobalamin 5'-phosphate synthase [Halalkalicoccus jeotgali B3]ELY38034.1 cobalamin 5'-phosphate synthase [Halalkalicoccus jeotgali B3]
MVLNALRGALGFLTRLPVGRDERAWEAFRRTPTAFPLAGYPVGALLAVPLLVPGPSPTVAFAFLLGVYLLTGINHADGVADLGDAAVVHGGPEKRRDAMHDTTTGVGAILALGTVLVGLALAGLALAALPLAVAAGIVLAAEVGAKFGIALLCCLGDPAHEGLGSQFADHAPRALLGPLAATLPVAVLSLPAFASVCGAGLAAVVVGRWANRRLGGVSGDVLGAANEIGRVLALHAGVIAWTLW